ncbi:YiiD C-terminal domain-containing protein [Devosia sp. SL43]|uniref:YiiD C-terminal domain-containing protein n=1 Tax=Devosia sp. SL43 TaxID=2806348 RepID=UPI001F469F82|nr:YiiD C-terminal domain-containing protein [Devosia sp. SL43]UJW85975.1 thioesterase domain-containing protein [Devosia sp. SL43]
MTPAALETYLHDHIPLSRAMAVRVVSSAPGHVELSAPLGPNINVHGTAFGGSVSTLGVLAAWSALHLRLDQEAIACQLVIHRSQIDYLAPIAGDFTAIARLDEANWPAFLHMLTRRGKARLTVVAELSFAGQVAARLTGEFVTIAEPHA